MQSPQAGLPEALQHSLGGGPAMTPNLSHDGKLLGSPPIPVAPLPVQTKKDYPITIIGTYKEKLVLRYTLVKAVNFVFNQCDSGRCHSLTTYIQR